MKTYYGTFTDIEESDITCIFDKYTLYFTSEFNKNKFIKEVKDYIYIEELKIKTRYNLNIYLGCYFALVLYKKIQKKGTKVVNNITHKKIDIDKEFE